MKNLCFKKIIVLLLIFLLIIPITVFADSGTSAESENNDSDKPEKCVVKSSFEIKDWEKIKDEVAPLCGDLRTDILTIARVQIGYEEWKGDKIIAEDGKEHCYTLYGQFFGDRWAHCDWCAAFVSFCAYYANAPKDFPLDVSTLRMEAKCKQLGYWREWSQYIPKPGDIVLVSTNANPNAVCHAAIVEQVFAKTKTRDAYIVTIEGNTRIESGAIGVKREKRSFDCVIGYCVYEKEMLEGVNLNKGTWRDDKLKKLYENDYYYAPVPKKEVLEFISADDTNWYKFWFDPEALGLAPIIADPTSAFKVNEVIDVIKDIQPTPKPTPKSTPTPELTNTPKPTPTPEPTSFPAPTYKITLPVLPMS